MAWRDGVVQGSFRGVPFLWQELGGEGGRRIVKHVYPDRDTAEGEDLGRKPGTISLTVFILANDFATYRQKRDALITACDAGGIGQLVHPTRGTMQVFCETCRVNEDCSAQGRCDFELQFWNPGSSGPAAGAVMPDMAAMTDSAAMSVQSAAMDSFAERFTISGFIGDVMQPVVDQIDAVSDVLGEVQSAIGTATGFVAGLVNEVTGAINQAVGIANQVTGQIASVVAFGEGLVELGEATIATLATPVVLAENIAGLIGGLPFTAPSNNPIPINSWSQIRQMGPLGAGTPPASLLTPPPVKGFSQQQIDTIRAGLTSVASLGLSAEVVLDGPALPALTVMALAQLAQPAVIGVTTVAQNGVAPIAVPGLPPIVARQLAAALAPGMLLSAGSPVLGVTPSRVQLAINQVELCDLVRRLALVQVAEAVVSSVYPTVEAAQAARDDVAARLDVEMQLTTDARIYQAMAALRVQVVKTINATIATLPQIKTVQLARTRPALVIAHRYYDDPSLADDIVARNDVWHPGFVPGGVPLKILTNVG